MNCQRLAFGCVFILLSSMALTGSALADDLNLLPLSCNRYIFRRVLNLFNLFVIDL